MLKITVKDPHTINYRTPSTAFLNTITMTLATFKTCLRRIAKEKIKSVSLLRVLKVMNNENSQAPISPSNMEKEGRVHCKVSHPTKTSPSLYFPHISAKATKAAQGKKWQEIREDPPLGVNLPVVLCSLEGPTQIHCAASL